MLTGDEKISGQDIDIEDEEEKKELILEKIKDDDAKLIKESIKNIQQIIKNNVIIKSILLKEQVVFDSLLESLVDQLSNIITFYNEDNINISHLKHKRLLDADYFVEEELVQDKKVQQQDLKDTIKDFSNLKLEQIHRIFQSIGYNGLHMLNSKIDNINPKLLFSQHNNLFDKIKYEILNEKLLNQYIKQFYIIRDVEINISKKIIYQYENCIYFDKLSGQYTLIGNPMSSIFPTTLPLIKMENSSLSNAFDIIKKYDHYSFKEDNNFQTRQSHFINEDYSFIINIIPVINNQYKFNQHFSFGLLILTKNSLYYIGNSNNIGKLSLRQNLFINLDFQLDIPITMRSIYKKYGLLINQFNLYNNMVNNYNEPFYLTTAEI